MEIQELFTVEIQKLEDGVKQAKKKIKESEVKMKLLNESLEHLYASGKLQRPVPSVEVAESKPKRSPSSVKPIKVVK